MERTIALRFAIGLVAILGTTVQAVPLPVGGGWCYLTWAREDDDAWNDGGPFTFTWTSWTLLTVTDMLYPGDQLKSTIGISGSERPRHPSGTSLSTIPRVPLHDDLDLACSYHAYGVPGRSPSPPGDHSITLYPSLDPYVCGMGGMRVDESESPAYQDYEVVPVDAAQARTPVTLIFSEMIELGETSLVISHSGPACPAGYRMGVPPTYYDLAPPQRTRRP